MMTSIIQTIVFSLATLTFTSGILILIAFAADRIFGKKYSAGCKYIVWTLIILRMCIPLSVETFPNFFKVSVPETVIISSENESESPTSVAKPNGVSNSEVNADDDSKFNESALSIPAGEHDLTDVSADTPPVISDDASVNHNGVISKNISSDSVKTENPNYISLRTEQILIWVFLIWASVAALILIVRMTGYMVFSHRIRKTMIPADAERFAVLKNIAQEAGLAENRIPDLYINGSANSPMLFGFIRPKILLPDIEHNDIQIGGILSHELIHYRRKDLWIKLACVIATSLNWFNPLVYLAAGRTAREMELSCDEAVLRDLDKADRLSYSRSMLAIIEQSRAKHSSLTTQFDPKKSAVVERFANILDDKKRKRGIGIMLVALILCAMSTGIVIWQAESEQNESRANGAETIIADTEAVAEKFSEINSEPKESVTETEETTDEFENEIIETMHESNADTVNEELEVQSDKAEETTDEFENEIIETMYESNADTVNEEPEMQSDKAEEITVPENQISDTTENLKNNEPAATTIQTRPAVTVWEYDLHGSFGLDSIDYDGNLTSTYEYAAVLDYRLPQGITTNDIFVNLYRIYPGEEGIPAYRYEKDGEGALTNSVTIEKSEYFTTSNGYSAEYKMIYEEGSFLRHLYNIKVSEQNAINFSFRSTIAEKDESLCRDIVSSVKYTDNSGYLTTLTRDDITALLKDFKEREQLAYMAYVLPLNTSAEMRTNDAEETFLPYADNEYGIKTEEDFFRFRNELLYGDEYRGGSLVTGDIYSEVDGEFVNIGQRWMVVEGALYRNTAPEHNIEYEEKPDYSSITEYDIYQNAVNVTWDSDGDGELDSEEYIYNDGKLYCR